VAGIDNLTPFEPGHPGNPKGRGKGTKNRATILRQFADLELKEKPNANFDLPAGMTVEDAVALALLKKAQEGDVAAIKELNDTLYGKITENINNNHSFTQMGRVVVKDEKGEEAGSLNFDVGGEVDQPVQE
jgi:uncharacterized protein YkvS